MKKSLYKFKKYVVGQGLLFDACESELTKVFESRSLEELFGVIKENLYWCTKRYPVITTNSLLEYVNIEDLNNNGFLVKQELDTVGSGTYWLFDSTINCLTNSAVVECMYGFSKIGQMNGNSKVNTMRDCSVINYMRDNSQIGRVKDVCVIHHMCDSSRIESLAYSAVVKQWYDSAIILPYTPTYRQSNDSSLHN